MMFKTEHNNLLFFSEYQKYTVEKKNQGRKKKWKQNTVTATCMSTTLSVTEWPENLGEKTKEPWVQSSSQ